MGWVSPLEILTGAREVSQDVVVVFLGTYGYQNDN